MAIPAVIAFRHLKRPRRHGRIARRIIDEVTGGPQPVVPIEGVGKETVLAVDNCAGERVGGRCDRNRAGDRRLEIFQFGLAIRKQIVLQRREIDLYFSNQALQVHRVLQRIELNARTVLHQQAL